MSEPTIKRSPRGVSSTAPTARVRTHTWTHPVQALEAAGNLNGYDWLKAVAEGHLPMPRLLATLGFDCVTPIFERGAATFFLEPAEYHYNLIGSVHGGVLSALLDTAMGCAVHSLLSEGTIYTTLDLSVRFVRPVTAKTGTLRCEGSVLSSGRNVATAQGTLKDEMGKLFAHATCTCMLLDKTLAVPRPKAGAR